MRATFVIALFSSALAAEVSPVEKVITLLEDLKSETEAAGKKEASTYDTFACFCKSETLKYSDSIKTGQDKIDELAATLEEQTGISNAKQLQIEELTTMIGNLQKDMDEITARREKEKAKYSMSAMDFTKAVSSLEGAIADLMSVKETMSSSFLEKRNSIRKTILKSITLADVDLSPKQQRTVTAFLQTDEDPENEEFEFSGDELMQTFAALEKEFSAKKVELDEIEGQNKKNYNEVMKSKKAEKKAAEGDKRTQEGEKDTADGNIDTASEGLTKEEVLLKDDEAFLKDLTSKCALKAHEWDQRSQMRADEVTALAAAIKIIKEGVQANSAVNKRALLQDDKDFTAAHVQVPKTPVKKEEARGPVENNANKPRIDTLLPSTPAPNTPGHMSVPLGDMMQLESDLSFIQLSNTPRMKIASLVQHASKVSSSASQQAALKQKVIDSLVESGQKLGSVAISHLAMKIAEDPFIKVKKLIQELIERLVTEAAEEATKKGWCDTEMGEAKHNRDSNMAAIVEVNAELKLLEAKKATLEEEISTLTTELNDLNDSLTKETKMRGDEKAENMDTLDKAKAGLAATKDAYDVLTAFYEKAAKASLLQVSRKNEKAPYKGGQDGAGGITAMLEVIISDFERTIKVTTEAEKASHREFVEFEKTSKTSIATKETGKSQSESDLKSTDSKIVESMDDLGKHQSILDDSLKELEDLKPSCVDTGMSYADRVQKRKDEIDALKSALCSLDPNKVEDQCK
jgi:hypothetical protein